MRKELLANTNVNGHEWKPKSKPLCELAAIVCPAFAGSDSIFDQELEEFSQTYDSEELETMTNELPVKHIKIEAISFDNDDETVEKQQRLNDDSTLDTADIKRLGAVNFTAAEENVLIELVFNKKEIVENKSLKADSIQNMSKAWEEIAIEFNRRCPSNVVSSLMPSLKRFFEICNFVIALKQMSTF